jgi:hypothetical protein
MSDETTIVYYPQSWATQRRYSDAATVGGWRVGSCRSTIRLAVSALGLNERRRMATNLTDADRLPPSTPERGARSSAIPRRALSGLVVSSVAGTALVILAYHEAESSAGHLHFAVFWAGVLLTLGGCVYAGVICESTRVLTAVLLWFGIFTFLPKYLMTRNGPAYFDEFGHLRHVTDMLATGHIEVSDPLLPVVQYYPGLGLATEAVHYVTRLNLWHSGQIVVLAAHCVALLLIAAICNLLGFSSRGRFFAALVFAANPSFIYFDSQYAYESLAITLMLATVYCCLRVKQSADARDGAIYTAIGCLMATCTIFTHHVTAIVTLALCVLIAIATPSYGYMGDPDTRARIGQYRRSMQSWVIAGWVALGVGVWVLGVAGTTRQYLFPSIDNGVKQVWQKIFGSSSARTASTGGGTAPAQNISHTPFAGTNVPIYEKYAALVVPFLVLVILAVNVWSIWKSRDRQREIRLGAPFIIFAAGYFLSLPLALTSGGNEAAHRSWPFLYVGVAILSVWCISRPGLTLRTFTRPRVGSVVSDVRTVSGAVTLALFLVLLGNNVAGTNIIYRFPGPFVFGSDARFNTPELSSLTKWASKNLPAGAGVVTDRFTGQALLVGTRLGLPTSTQAAVYGLYRSPQTPDVQLRHYLKAHNFEYFVLDERITTEEPSRSFFQSYAGYDESISPSLLASIHDSSFIRLIHSTANYRVYQLNP